MLEGIEIASIYGDNVLHCPLGFHKSSSMFQISHLRYSQLRTFQTIHLIEINIICCVILYKK